MTTMDDDYQKQFDRFAADVANHALTVLRDDGLYRHLRCSTGSFVYSFDVITWPGHLCYTGDMGTFVFSRLPDMFQFFRGLQTAMIDRGYLAEKALAVDKSDGLRRFSAALFEQAIRRDFDAFTEDFTAAEKADLWDDVVAEVLPASEDGHAAAIDAAHALEHNGQPVFTEFWEHRLEEYTTRFWWACYAIPWAIAKYDAAKTVQPVAS